MMVAVLRGIRIPPIRMKSVYFHLETLDGAVFPVGEARCLIGRLPGCDVQLAVPDVSRRHAMILREGHDWWLMDAGSRGGTWLNQTRLTGSARLQAGDLIGIGSLVLTFLPMEPAPAGSAGRVEMADTTLPGDGDWLVTQETAVLWVDVAGNLKGGSSGGFAWLAVFFDGVDGALPAPVAEWLRSATAQRLPFQRRVGEERLRISAFPMDGDRQLLVLRRLGPAFSPQALKSLGLTPAECELVPWLIRGKRNDEMATILGRAPKTVEKQVASILSRLQVETRTAAAWNIIERMGAHH